MTRANVGKLYLFLAGFDAKNKVQVLTTEQQELMNR